MESNEGIKFIMENLKQVINSEKNNLINYDRISIILISSSNTKKNEIVLYLLVKESKEDRMTIEKIIDSDFDIRNLEFINFLSLIDSELQKNTREIENKIKDLVKKEEMEESIENLKDDIEKEYISYRGALGAWGLIAAILTVALTAMMLLIRDLTGTTMYIEGLRQFTLEDIIKVSILAGITIYVVSFVMQFISKRLGISKQ
jgi:transcriptional regulator with GAF, ATPase, and Fis domain